MMEQEEKRTSVVARFFRRLTSPTSDYCVFLCSTTDEKNLPVSIPKRKGRAYITVTGSALPAVEAVDICYYGEWVTGKKYGLSFRADSYQFVEPKTQSGILAFLKSKAFPGIGAKTAKAIVDTFGDDTLEVIKETPQKLLTIEGITTSKLGNIIMAYKKNEAYNTLAVFLYPYGISGDSIARIHEKFGSEASELIKKNPYLIEEIRGIGFHTCDRLARGLNTALDSIERIKGAVFAVLHEHQQRTGDTCMEIPAWEENTLKLLNEGITPPPVSQKEFRLAVGEMRDRGEIVFHDRSYVLTRKYDEAEAMSARKLMGLLKKDVSSTEFDTVLEVNRFRKSSPIKWSDRQIDAILMALSYRVSIITGGPGTGKTSILTAIIECYRNLFHKEVILLAPTGKAARRMTEATGYKAATIHSRIGIYETEKDQTPKILPSGLVVVDESSMLDTLVLYELLKAIPERDAHLLFIGDIDQLPSVGAGSVLHDMIASGAIPVAKLTEIFRQDKESSIIPNAYAINSGSTDLHFGKDFTFVPASSEEEALEVIKKAYKEEADCFGTEQVALLSPLRRNQGGRFSVVADELNKELQEVMNPRRAGCFCILNGTEYRCGDRVMQWKNSAESANGDTGVITAIGEKNGDTVVEITWDNQNKTVESRLSMADISLAYAISVHKSQGSQYNSVIIPLLSAQNGPIFRRNLLYTGVTRAKSKVILVGDVEALNRCILMEDAAKRKTLFRERIIEEQKNGAQS